MNLTTIDVLWDVSTLIVPYLVWHIFGAYNVAIIITYIDVGFALSVPTSGQCEGLNSWNDTCRIPRFFMPYSEGFGWCLRGILSLFFSKIGRIIMILDGVVKC